MSIVGGSDANVDAIKAMIVAGILSLFIKALGLFKESMIAYFFGVSPYVDFYVLALLFVTFFVGPVGGALATLLTQKYIEICDTVSSGAAAAVFAQCQIFGLICMLLIAAVEIGALQIPSIQYWFGNRFTDLETAYLLVLLPISFLSLMSVINASVLTARKSFKAYASLPALVPIAIITTLIICPKEYLITGLLLGTLLGYCIEFLVGVVCLRDILPFITYRAIRRPTSAFHKIARSMRPMFISGVIMGGCLIVDQFMAVLAGEGAVAMINFGNRITLGLISVIAIFWTVLYPNFVKMAAAADFHALRTTFWRFGLLGVVGLVPVCGLIAYFSKDLVILLFERGAFLQSDTVIVAEIQALYLMHIPFYVLCMICMRIANALENTQILLLGNLLSLVLNIALNLVFIERYGVIGIPIATLTAYGIMVLFWSFAANWLITKANAA